MKHQIEFKDFQPPQKIREVIENLIKRLEMKVKGFAAFLRVVAEEHSTHRFFHVSLTLELSGKTLAAKEEGLELERALRAAFDEIERQLLDYESMMRREHLWKRLGLNQEIPQSDSDPQTFFSLVRPHLEELSDFVAHELSSAEATGDLARGELTVEDVVDEVLLRAQQEFSKDPAQGEIRSWLIKLAIERLEAEINRSKSERSRTVHIEEDIPETPPAEQVSTLGDEILDFYQPDEDVKLEDIVPDMEASTPEQEAEKNELRQCVNKALRKMPKEQRRLLVLRHVQGLKIPELARALGMGEREINRTLEDAGGNLRRKLLELGCRSTASDALTRTAR